MRIGIDARFWGPVGKGLGRYTQKLIENLEKLDQENEYFIFLVKENFDAYQPKNKNFQKVLADYRWYSFSEQWNMPRVLNKYKLDLVHFPHFNVPLFYFRPFVITIHDLILLHFPTVRSTTLNRFWYWFKFLAYKIIIFSAILRSRKIIAVSEFTKQDILENYRVADAKIEVTYEAVDDFVDERKRFEMGSEIKKEKGEKYGIIRPYILYVGNAYPHKNLERLVSAFDVVRLRNPELNLVLVGKEDYFYKRLKKIVEEKPLHPQTCTKGVGINYSSSFLTENCGCGGKQIKNVIFAGFIPDADLKIVYREALAYVFPSLYEGFGLPPLEAMAEGVPVISSDHPCMREILGESALYFDGRNEKDIADKIEKIISGVELRNDLIRKGSEQVKKYSWENMARLMLEVYKN